MNLVERWFALLTALHLRRGVHPNVLALTIVTGVPRRDERGSGAVYVDQDRREHPSQCGPILSADFRLRTLKQRVNKWWDGRLFYQHT